MLYPPKLNFLIERIRNDIISSIKRPRQRISVEELERLTEDPGKNVRNYSQDRASDIGTLPKRHKDLSKNVHVDCSV